MHDLRLTYWAASDWSDATDWYERRSVLASQRFDRAVDAAFLTIKSDPIRYPKFDRICRYAVVRGFPFNVLFRIEGSVVIIVAIAHQKRRPFWRGRPGSSP